MSTDNTPNLPIQSTQQIKPQLQSPSIIMDDSLSQRRSSSRSIKRKKFDDELVESSILIPKNQRGKNVILPPIAMNTAIASTSTLANQASSSSSSSSNLATTTTNTIQPTKLNSPAITDNNLTNFQSTPSTSSAISSPLIQSIQNTNLIETQRPCTPVKSTVIETPIAATTSIATSLQIKKQPKPITTTKRRRYRNAHNNAVKDLGRFKPHDDLALVIAVQQLNDLESVYRSIKFSCKFTLKEIENRWFGLLYDPTIAKIGVAAMRQLHPDIVSQIHANAPYNEDEEKLLKAIQSTNNPNNELFNEILQKNIEIFLPYRTAKELRSHWLLLKHFHLLDDQNIKNFNKLDEVLSFSDAEEQIENELQSMLNSNVPSPINSAIKQEDIINQELALNNRKTKREIRQLENEIPKWQVLVDSVTGVAPSDFDNETLAVLRGRLVRYLMRSREITIGRCTKDCIVDVNLSLEGPSFKISRKQALIKLNSNGDFIITNTGKHAFIVDSKPVLGNLSSCKLSNNSVVEIAGLRFVFLINQDLIGSVRLTHSLSVLQS